MSRSHVMFLCAMQHGPKGEGGRSTRSAPAIPLGEARPIPLLRRSTPGRDHLALFLGHLSWPSVLAECLGPLSWPSFLAQCRGPASWPSVLAPFPGHISGPACIPRAGPDDPHGGLKPRDPLEALSNDPHRSQGALF